ncbi:hypothetical protein CONPUDRAFT_151065 [Coniophora puteana RWD-64-598 SS2]|uniref:LysM domain-containing protein n=1 Tax=Coniophora puteana (strain RWD-64-598) TaxID=741705 RepID=A0A5M3MZF5_CONPW|nr:uncharacterized protein CONPUDRAFT_151065 [Coniophora puteana RWD-64-598 SS2]EIW84015.1 hypothetical protein CONPUDRAFT_151065 [Coniophora puteana RWD-64-598 SS2]
MNINGGVDDEDVFSIGDDEDDEDIAGSQLNGAAVNPGRRTPPPAYEEFAHGETPGLTSSGGSDHRNDPPATRQSAEPSVHDWDNASSETVEVGTTFSPSPTPQKYHIRPQDTLQGIALRFGLNARALCKLNNLPPSTLSTTPHLLHTRTVLTLPPSAASSSQPQTPPGQPSEEYERRRALERASKRLQTLTKETDWRVAKAYAALADDPDAEAAFEAKLKELMLSSQGGGESSLEARAVDQYLDDLEWEATEIREGRGVRIEGLRASSSKTAKG